VWSVLYCMLIGASFVISLPAKNKQTMPRRHLCLSAQQAGREREREVVKPGGREREKGWGRQAVFLLTNYLNTLRLLLHGNGSGSVLQHIHTHILAYTVFLLATFCFNHKIRTFYPLRHNQCMYVSV